MIFFYILLTLSIYCIISIAIFYAYKQKPKFTLCCRTIEKIENKYWFLGLCLVIRFIAGVGSAMLTVAATSIVMKCTAYSSSTIVVS